MAKRGNMQKDYAVKTLQEARDFYRKIKSIYDATGYSQSYQQTSLWEGSSRNIRDMTGIINSDADPSDNYRLMQIGHFSKNQPGPVGAKAVDWYIAYLERQGYNIFDLGIYESTVVDPEDCVEREGRILTPDLLRKTIQCLEVLEYCSIPKSNLRIVELGGGCGNFARVLKLLAPNSVHIDIDIPETLYFAYLFLKLSSPDAKVLYVTDKTQLKDGLQEFDFIFLPTIFAESILEYEFDLFCNTASLGEMKNSVIRYWMDFVQNKLEVKYFFGINRFLNTISFPNLQHRLGENECSVLFDAKWKILKWELEPLFINCPYATNETARNLEIIAERLEEDSINEHDNQIRSRQIVEDLKDEAWLRVPTWYSYAHGGCDSLAHNLTMTGTLFKLWDSIRLYPNETNIAMMIIYLNFLKRNRPFEEFFYYKDLLNTLISNGSLLEGDSKALCAKVLKLPKTYDSFSIIGFLPSSMRPPLIKLLRPITTRWSKVVTASIGKLRRARLY